MSPLIQILHKCKNQNYLITTTIIDEFSLHYKDTQFLSIIGAMSLSIMILLSVPIVVLSMFIISILMILELFITKILLLFGNTGIPGWNLQHVLRSCISAIKNIPSRMRQLRKKTIIEDEDESLNPEYSEMPWGLDEVSKYNRGITSEEQLENIRKKL